MMYWSLNGTQLHQGHVIDVLRSLAIGSVHLVVTSPPYWGLRDYGLAPVEWEPVTFTPVAGLPEMTVPGCAVGCDHVWGDKQERHDVRETTQHGKTRTTDRFYGSESRRFNGNHQKHTAAQWCQICGGVKCCLGLEPDPWMYVAHLVAVFREIRRVLRDDGVMFLNLGDSYANDTKWGGQSGGKNYTSAAGGYQGQRQKRHTGLKPKDLVGIPWRVAFALQADGWWLRSAIVWQKTNCMPESVRDRPTKSYEMVFLLAKSASYFYDAFAIREGIGKTGIVKAADLDRQPFVFSKDGRLEKPTPQGAHISVSALDHDGDILKLGIRCAASILDFAESQNKLGLLALDSEIGQERASDSTSPGAVSSPIIRGATAQATRFTNGDISAKEFLEQLNSLGIALPNSEDFKELGTHSGASPAVPVPLIHANGDTSVRINDASQVSQLEFIHDNTSNEKYTIEHTPLSSGRNCRDVWTIPTASYPGAHFATFPPALVRPMIKAGTSEKGVCPECGASWERVTAKEFVPQGDVSTDKGVRGAYDQKPLDVSNQWQGYPRGTTNATTTGWRPGCECSGLVVIGDQPRKPTQGEGVTDLQHAADLALWGWKMNKWQALWNDLKPLYEAEPKIPATVLDPFAGSGTSAEVAIELGRKCILIEQSKAYCDEQIIPRLESPIAVRLI